MSAISFLLCIFFFLSCQGQVIKSLDIVPYDDHPGTPSQEDLQRVSQQKMEELDIKTSPAGGGYTLRTYFLNGSLYDGWGYQIFLDTEHRFRYTKFEKGLAVWQIGYFDNGVLGHDFHMKDGRNYGSQRMWHKGGGLYIDTYFLKGAIQHGLQYRWHSNGELAREALFEKGELIYEVLFDEHAKIVERKGNLPSKYH